MITGAKPLAAAFRPWLGSLIVLSHLVALPPSTWARPFPSTANLPMVAGVPFSPGDEYQLDGGGAAIAMADFNGDGHVDAAIAQPSVQQVSIWLGNEQGTLTKLDSLDFVGPPIDVVNEKVKVDHPGN